MYSHKADKKCESAKISSLRRPIFGSWIGGKASSALSLGPLASNMAVTGQN